MSPANIEAAESTITSAMSSLNSQEISTLLIKPVYGSPHPSISILLG